MTRMAGTRLVVAGLAVAVLAAPVAAAATLAFLLQVHARLTPVSGTTASGRFSAVLARSIGGNTPQAHSALPRSGSHWRLAWKVSLPALSGRMTASLRVRAYRGAAPATRMLCRRCTTSASGALTVTASQVMRIANGHAFVVVRTRSATLRGTVKSMAEIPVTK
jgi:hypothetical protein